MKQMKRIKQIKTNQTNQNINILQFQPVQLARIHLPGSMAGHSMAFGSCLHNLRYRWSRFKDQTVIPGKREPPLSKKHVSGLNESGTPSFASLIPCLLCTASPSPSHERKLYQAQSCQHGEKSHAIGNYNAPRSKKNIP